MADRAATRLAIDVGFGAALIACGVVAYFATRTPPVPSEVCASDSGAPRYDAMLADGTLSIGVVFGELVAGTTAQHAVSEDALTASLRARGFVETASDHFELGRVAVNISRAPDHAVALSDAINGALAVHDVVYFNGHSQSGALELHGPDAYRVIVMDTCYSTQLYSAKLVGARRDVIGNREISVSGSIETLLVMIDGIQERADWEPMLESMNARAVERARLRGSISRFKDPEEYRRDVSCR